MTGWAMMAVSVAVAVVGLVLFGSGKKTGSWRDKDGVSYQYEMETGCWEKLLRGYIAALGLWLMFVAGLFFVLGMFYALLGFRL